MLKDFIKKIIRFAPFPLTKNQYYDRLTEKVIKKICDPTSVCVDIGAHKGDILQLFIKHCPQVLHYAFEPIPQLFYLLKRKYASAAKVFPYALAATKATTTFNYVVTNPAYSGLQKRVYDKPEKDTIIEVETELLDNIICRDINVRLIKIDVEGGEYNVLKGAEQTIARSKPFILFEFGKGGSDTYGVTAEKMHAYLTSLGYNLNTLSGFLKEQQALTLQQFETYYNNQKEYFFIAIPT